VIRILIEDISAAEIGVIMACNGAVYKVGGSHIDCFFSFEQEQKVVVSVVVPSCNSFSFIVP
jgi:hypothetical protein